MKPKDRFLLKQEHLTLLQNANVIWEDAEAGAPVIHTKRPYGDSGVIQTIFEILGWDTETCPHCDESIGEDRSEEAEKLHRETEIAMQIVLVRAGDVVELGWYRRSTRDDRVWIPEGQA